VRATVLLLAAGSGARLFARQPKALVQLLGVPLVRRSADAACAAIGVDELVVAAPNGFVERVEEALDGVGKPVRVVSGGATRQSSAAAALSAVASADAVIVHDAARALCSPELFDRCLDELDRGSAACVAIPVPDTIKEVHDGVVVNTLDRSRLWAAQTPQAFRAAVYRRAHAAAARDGIVATDDAALVERLGVRVRVIPGDPTNIKITTAADLKIAEVLLGTHTHDG
jgi:2-C-methyl-D-erythritol 4-phosphate cytidylyltransferase